MLLKKVEYENFRNFKDYGKIVFSTDGKVTIVYGKNGDGKTTFHQLLHWIFYGTVNFNKTTTNKLYNLETEKTAIYNDLVSTWGRVEFSHEGEDYCLYREVVFHKELLELKMDKEVVEFLKKNGDNWDPEANTLEEINEQIDLILPLSFSDYFFFDGETMIADLKGKSSTAQRKLTESLYNMFDLSYLKCAISDLGDKHNKSTVIGHLYKQKEKIDLDDQEMIETQANLEKAKGNVEKLRAKLVKNTKEKLILESRNKELSEQIGGIRATSELQKDRNRVLNEISGCTSDIEITQRKFGADLYSFAPKRLLKQRFDYAQLILNDKIDDTKNKLPLGLEKELLISLINSEDKTCICGNKIGEDELRRLNELLLLFPPNSYKNVLARMQNGFDRIPEGDINDVREHIAVIVRKNREIAGKNEQILIIDEKMKEAAAVDDLVEERRKNEGKIVKIDKDLGTIQGNLAIQEKIYAQLENKFDNMTSNNEKLSSINAKIRDFDTLKEMFEETLKENSEDYRQKLADNIDYFLKKMLTSERQVVVKDNFEVKIFDSYKDESKSEGQFAIVSFAYIGAIMKMLGEDANLMEKKYPLVLDGPFSKLDEDQRQNVIDVLPNFAPQIILFSKDKIHQYFDENQVGKIWTIKSNNEKNNAKIKEGYLWED